MVHPPAAASINRARVRSLPKADHQPRIICSVFAATRPLRTGQWAWPRSLTEPDIELHDCSGCFRLEPLPGRPCTHWKAPPFTAHTQSGPSAKVDSIADAAYVAGKVPNLKPADFRHTDPRQGKGWQNEEAAYRRPDKVDSGNL